MSTLNLIEVTKRFADVVAVNRLSLEVGKGECFSFLGPSGCGKTTTLRMIAGFEDLDEGEIEVAGRLISSSRSRFYLPPEKRDFGMVFQAFAVWPHLTVWDNVAFPLQIRKVARSEILKRVKQAIRHTGLAHAESRYPSNLSGGEQQRIALARAVAIHPQVMLLDEPLSNLDPKLREEMRFEIKDLQRKFEFTIIYVTHDQAEAMALSDRMLVMDHGVVQQVDTPLNIYNRPANQFVFGFIGLSNFIPVLLKNGRAFVEGAEEAGAVAAQAPLSLGARCLLACRPGEVDFLSEGGVRGKVTRKTFLGDIVDYRLNIGSVEIRVQKPRRQALLGEGEDCRLRINRASWYPQAAEHGGIPDTSHG